MRHSTILSVTQQFCQDVDFINKFDTIWSSKWLWSIIFFSESGYLDDRLFQHMHVTVKALQDLHVFAHCRYMDLLVWPLCICQTQQSAFADKWYQRFVWNKAGFLPKQFVYFPTPVICICRHVIYPKLSEMVPWLFSSLLINWNSFVQPIFTQPFLQSDGWWWIEIFGDGWWWMKGWVIAGCLLRVKTATAVAAVRLIAHQQWSKTDLPIFMTTDDASLHKLNQIRRHWKW